VSDNIFDRLRELLESSGPVNWKLAREIAESVSGVADPVEPWVAEEFEELTHTAALRVSAASPLDATPASGSARVVDRRTWASENVTGFAYLAEPLASKMAGPPGQSPFDAVLGPLGPALVGMQMGSMAGFMSLRVLAQFDVGLPVDAVGAYYVAPNVAAFADDHSLDLRQTRLWVALHEVTHQAEMAVRWVRPHLRGLMTHFLDGLTFDSSALEEKIQGIADPESLERLLEDPAGLSGLLAGPESEQALAAIQSFMALLEGYAEWLVDRAAPGLIPEGPRLREAIDRRRAEPSQGEQMLQRVLGLDLQHHHYRRGTIFCDEVARRWGEDSLGRIWDGPAMLPTPAELADPLGWAARVLL
jgi:putative hydrolase